MRPRFPSWIRSRIGTPRPTYRLAIDTTSRRLADVSSRRAASPSLIVRRSRRCSSNGSSFQRPSVVSPEATAPASIRLASSTSSSAVRSGTLPISFRYIFTGSDEALARAMAAAATRAGSWNLRRAAPGSRSWYPFRWT